MWNDKIISVKVELSREDCYCSIQTFYDRIADIFGYDYDLETTNYDCTKISVSRPVLLQSFNYYEIERGVSRETTGIKWLLFGPKIDIDDDRCIVEIQNGFFIGVDQREDVAPGDLC